MKITYESDNKDVGCTFTVPEDTVIYDMMDTLEKLLIGIGYDQNTIKEGFLTKAEVYKNE